MALENLQMAGAFSAQPMAAARPVVPPQRDYLSQYMDTIQPLDASLNKRQKNRMLIDAGLSLLAGAADTTSPMAADLAAAGDAAMGASDRSRNTNLARSAVQADAQRSYLEQAMQAQQDRISNRRETLANMFDRQYKSRKMANDAAQNQNMRDYRMGRLGVMRANQASDAALNQARIESEKAQAQKYLARAGSYGGPGGLDSGEVLLKSGQPASISDLNRLYGDMYGEWDPLSQQYTYGPKAPRLDEFYRRLTTPATNPFLAGQPAPTGPSPVSTDYSTLWSE